MQRFLLRAIALLLTVFFSAPFARAQPLPDRRPFVGRVTGPGGAPLAGARIVLRRQDDNGSFAFWGGRAVSDARGEFSFPDAEEGSYYLSVEADGYSPEQNKGITLDASSTPFQLSLQRLIDYRMQLLTSGGEPLRNVRVSMRLRPELGGVPRFWPTTTDANGIALVTTLIPGRYAVQVVAGGAGYAVLDNLNVQPQDNNPLVVKMQEGGKLRVVARETITGVDGSPQPDRAIGGARLTIQALRPNEEQARAQGLLAPDEDTALYTAHIERLSPVTRDGDGVLEVSDMAPGRYSLRLTLPGYDAPTAQTIEITKGETTLSPFNFNPLFNAAPLEVLVRDGDGKPLPNLALTLQLRPLPKDFPTPSDDIMAPAPPGFPMGIGDEIFNVLARRVQTDAEGRAMLYPVRPGKWRVSPTVPTDDPLANRLVFSDQEANVSAQGGSVTVQATKR